MSLVYLNGDYKQQEEANINVLDRGFTFGDGVYEVIPVFNQTVFRIDEHLQRLENSLKAIFMEMPLDKTEWQAIFTRLIDEVETKDQSIYLQITRGLSERDHDISLSRQPTVFVMSRPMQKKDFSEGIKAITHEDIRWAYCHIKAITLLPSVILRHIARQQDAKEAILIRDEHVTEGAASNVFIVKDNIVFTSPRNNEVLPGITLDLLLELLDSEEITYREEQIDKQALFTADEVWITSSTWEVVPVTLLDGQPVGKGKPGPMWERVYKRYQEYKQGYCQ